MANPNAAAVARTAVDMTKKEPPVAYSRMDCQAFVEACVNQNGGRMDYAGSNDMFRNACTWVGTLAEAKAAGRLVPGALLFILEQDGKEPARYKEDGLGNASHVGLYTDMEGVEVAHSSASRGMVCASTLKNGWTHVGWAREIGYAQEQEGVSELQYAATRADSGSTVNMRDKPNGKLMVRIPLGTKVPVYARQGGWAQVGYSGHTGWVDESYLEAAGGDTLVVERSAMEAIYRAIGKLLEGET